MRQETGLHLVRVVIAASLLGAGACTGIRDAEPGLITRGELKERIAHFRFADIDNKRVTLSGTVLARRIGSSYLLARPPDVGPDGMPDHGPGDCIGLFLTSEQFALLEGQSSRRLTGTFTLEALHRGGTVTTSITDRGRTSYPFCSSETYVAPFLYVEQIR